MVFRSTPFSLVISGAITFTNWARQASRTRSEWRKSELMRPPTNKASSKLYGSSSR